MWIRMPYAETENNSQAEGYGRRNPAAQTQNQCQYENNFGGEGHRLGLGGWWARLCRCSVMVRPGRAIRALSHDLSGALSADATCGIVDPALRQSILASARTGLFIHAV